MDSANKEPDLIATSQVATVVIEDMLNITIQEMRSPYPKYFTGRVLFAGILNSKGVSEKVIATLLRKKEDRIKVYIEAYKADLDRYPKYKEVTEIVNRLLTNNK